MPEFLENDLKAEARKKGFTGRKAARYVYGGMNNIGAMHGNQITQKGERMQAKHERDEAAGKFRSEGHSYDSRRPKRQVKSSYR